MEINNITYEIDMEKYDETTFLIKKDSFIVIDFEDDVGATVLRLNIIDNIILDGASIPNGFKWLFKTNYKNMDDNIGWIVHDLLYCMGAFTNCPLTFEGSNLMFLKIMEYYGTSNKVKRVIMYKAVSSVFGRKCFETINSFDDINRKKIKWGFR